MRAPLRTLLTLVACLPFLAAELHAQQARPPADARFVASSRGEVYYWIGCDSWRRLSAVNRIWFRTATEAEAAGYRPSTARGCAPQLDTALIVPRAGGRADCVVARIVDGDTFQCEGGSRVRLLLIDTPEAGQSELAEPATRLLSRLMPVGSRVRLEFDVRLTDRYGRLLAHTFAGDVFVNRELVRRGMANVLVILPNVRHVESIRAAADSARQERLGVWSRGAFE